MKKSKEEQARRLWSDGRKFILDLEGVIKRVYIEPVKKLKQVSIWRL